MASPANFVGKTLLSATILIFLFGEFSAGRVTDSLAYEAAPLESFPPSPRRQLAGGGICKWMPWLCNPPPPNPGISYPTVVTTFFSSTPVSSHSGTNSLTASGYLTNLDGKRFALTVKMTAATVGSTAFDLSKFEAALWATSSAVTLRSNVLKWQQSDTGFTATVPGRYGTSINLNDACFRIQLTLITATESAVFATC